MSHSAWKYKIERIAHYEHFINLNVTVDSYRQPKDPHNHVNTSVIPLLNLIFFHLGVYVQKYHPSLSILL